MVQRLNVDFDQFLNRSRPISGRMQPDKYGREPTLCRVKQSPAPELATGPIVLQILILGLRPSLSGLNAFYRSLAFYNILE